MTNKFRVKFVRSLQCGSFRSKFVGHIAIRHGGNCADFPCIVEGMNKQENVVVWIRDRHPYQVTGRTRTGESLWVRAVAWGPGAGLFVASDYVVCSILYLCDETGFVRTVP